MVFIGESFGSLLFSCSRRLCYLSDYGRLRKKENRRSLMGGCTKLLIFLKIRMFLLLGSSLGQSCGRCVSKMQTRQMVSFVWDFIPL